MLHNKGFHYNEMTTGPPYTETSPRGDGGFHHFGAVQSIQIDGKTLTGGCDKTRVPQCEAK